MFLNYNYILNDQEIIDKYERVEEYELNNRDWAYHNLNHVLNVVENVKIILESLDFDEEFIEESMIAALLHDVGANEGKDGHAYRSYLYAKDYLERRNINLKYKDQVLEAIRIHSDGFNTDNLIALAIILSDKLDVKENRISEEGKQVVGNRQYQYVKDIVLDIDNNKFGVNFIMSDLVDLDELEEYYFTTKIFKAIIVFSNKMNLDCNVFINGRKWDKFYLLKNED